MISKCLFCPLSATSNKLLIVLKYLYFQTVLNLFNSTFLKQKSLRLQKKSLISRYGVMFGSVLHFILDLKHASCTSAL